MRLFSSTVQCRKVALRLSIIWTVSYTHLVNYAPLRYADAVLMAAEAYNEIGNTTEAWKLLNDVRVREMCIRDR